MNYSPLQKARYEYQPKLPLILQNDINDIEVCFGESTQSVADQEKIKEMFPNTYGMKTISFKKGSSKAKKDSQVVGVILSGGQAPGGHNVITGLYDALKRSNKDNVLLGFKGGPSGLLEDDYIEFTDEFINEYRNTGGFDIIGSGRTKLETVEQFKVVSEVAKKHNLNAIVIIGGDDSNTNAAVLAEYMAATNAGVQVIGCPKTIDGDLKNDVIEVSFGFDTACKTYSELIGNIERDANSAKKYWHFIKVMGRSASHIALECALECQPNICLVGEEVEAKNMAMMDIVNYIADVVETRSAKGDNYGVAIVPEGLIEFIPEVKVLIAEINELLAVHEKDYAVLGSWDDQYNFVISNLTSKSANVFKNLPLDIQHQLLMDRDPHGNVQVSRIETEKLLITMVAKELKNRGSKAKFNALNHFFGYEGRCAFPSNFDADYCYSLGYNAFLLISNGLTGYMSTVTNLSAGPQNWEAGGIPITKMMNLERRHGEFKPVIRKALVELEGKPFKYFEAHRKEWAENTLFTFPGAIQYYGPAEVCDITTRTLALEQGN
ncbi:MAG: diphosphate--fructose-6-phosphate 1-phosphotransferase [Spirochaetales bacterium]|uniref:diphosphate--fructose-6-phosphate 1-phosphotransferase n=1 Tax=Bullifex sp. TaxID=2815808 RepID=UPI002A52B8F3|nr:diphosphate--fructose-6-phosphate 1-phosphotransferase [Bullifex sp.]MDD5973435.1 diphosphate--fructose-6-phosphate 1-phosphotransferase [Spirochaetales bacterium]MDD7271473.1 diphosphate--fructose-6-phosphate 1-phosphotransferase [Spirochaetales bacterium]MDY4066411.1 diphosphate--fructose-6-phosphate 1-phosphotransferase [Bullifex sp.]